MLRRKNKKTAAQKLVRWDIEWDHGRTMYGEHPRPKTLTAALKLVAARGAKADGYGFELESVTIKRVLEDA